MQTQSQLPLRWFEKWLTGLIILFSFLLFAQRCSAQAGHYIPVNPPIQLCVPGGELTVSQMPDTATLCVLFVPVETHREFLPECTFQANTRSFCPAGDNLSERWGKTVWLLQGSALTYPEFLRGYHLENNRDGRALYDFTDQIKAKFYRYLPPPVVSFLMREYTIMATIDTKD